MLTDVRFYQLLIFELITGGDYLFDPASGSRYSKDDEHIAQIMELMERYVHCAVFEALGFGVGFAVPSLAASHFSLTQSAYKTDQTRPERALSPSPPTGELRYVNKLRYWPLSSVLHDKYVFAAADAEALSAFLSPMLRLHPRPRTSSIIDGWTGSSSRARSM
ncbi:hypothetical protein D9615_002149 [Tricholomella constricta]|uniref:non-specific serine/threonine protein kinase n=1 Tax=Tricholomella constricta TaxID=117010 RepID=A0A8H5HND1_9AGAR|nr:hypothetical protein D9615_002149 [Tricholomella constricta]